MSPRICSTASGKATAVPSSRKQQDRLVGLDDDLQFAAAQPARFDFLIVRALGLGHLVQPHRAFVNFDLHFQHFLEAGFEHGQRPGDLFLAKLAEDFLQLGLGLLQLADGLFLLFGGALLLRFLQLLLGLLHPLLGFFQPLAGGIFRLLLILILRLPFAGLSWIRLRS